MATFYLALAVALVALGVIVALAVVLWRRRSAVAPVDAALPEPDDAGLAQPDETRFAPPEQPPARTPDVEPVAAPLPEAVPEHAAVVAAAVVSEVVPEASSPPPVDPTRMTRVTFHLYLPTQGHARSAGQIARREGYVADVQPPPDGTTSWRCILTREMTPTPEEIEIERASLAELAGGFGGHLDRWEAEAAR